MSEADFLEALQREVKRLTDDNRHFVAEIQMLQEQLDRLVEHRQAEEALNPTVAQMWVPPRKPRNF
jgi:predicted RNase H-like nuclease (RuvC/YqgF family)